MTSIKYHIFFDAEGTLYIPKNNFSYNDFWDGEHTLKRAKKTFKLDNGVKDLLKKLRKANFPMYIVSKHNYELLHNLLSHFKIKYYFTEIFINGNKGKRIKEVIKKKKISKNYCIMIGDIYELDILPVIKIGIKAIIINREYNTHIQAPRINNYNELLKLLNI